MRRADRLFRILQSLRRRDLTTARQLAEELEVSERTIYRDIRDLAASGVPVEGEAGVGYVLAAGYEVPPLMFDVEEVAALVLGMRIVASWADDRLARAAADVERKVEAVLPRALADELRATPLHAFDAFVDRSVANGLSELREAIRARQLVDLGYTDRDGAETRRTVRPLALTFWGNCWLLTAWCELRDDFRHFRLDRIAALGVTRETFADEQGKTFDAYRERLERHGC